MRSKSAAGLTDWQSKRVRRAHAQHCHAAERKPADGPDADLSSQPGAFSRRGWKSEVATSSASTEVPCSIEASNRRPPLWRLTFGTGRPVNRTPDDQGASCCSHEDPHQHGMFTRFLRGYRNYRKAITTVKSVEFHFFGNAKPVRGSGRAGGGSRVKGAYHPG